MCNPANVTPVPVGPEKVGGSGTNERLTDRLAMLELARGTARRGAVDRLLVTVRHDGLPHRQPSPDQQARVLVDFHVEVLPSGFREGMYLAFALDRRKLIVAHAVGDTPAHAREAVHRLLSTRREEPVRTSLHAASERMGRRAPRLHDRRPERSQGRSAIATIARRFA